MIFTGYPGNESRIVCCVFPFPDKIDGNFIAVIINVKSPQQSGEYEADFPLNSIGPDIEILRFQFGNCQTAFQVLQISCGDFGAA